MRFFFDFVFSMTENLFQNSCSFGNRSRPPSIRVQKIKSLRLVIIAHEPREKISGENIKIFSHNHDFSILLNNFSVSFTLLNVFLIILSSSAAKQVTSEVRMYRGPRHVRFTCLGNTSGGAGGDLRGYSSGGGSGVSNKYFVGDGGDVRIGGL